MAWPGLTLPPPRNARISKDSLPWCVQIANASLPSVYLYTRMAAAATPRRSALSSSMGSGCEEGMLEGVGWLDPLLGIESQTMLK